MKKGSHSSKGRDKVLAYWRKITDRDDFQKWVAETRKKYEIPEGGFEDDSRSPAPPFEWAYIKNLKKRIALANAVQKVVKKYGFPHSEGVVLGTSYLFYGQRARLGFDPHAFDLCVVTDVPEEKKYPYTRIISEADEKLYPVSVRISPEASLRDILDFVEKNYFGSIEYLQGKYKDPSLTIGKTRKRNPTKRSRDATIYRMREKEGLSARVIAREIRKQYGGELLDKGAIGKIISSERKRRK